MELSHVRRLLRSVRKACFPLFQENVHLLYRELQGVNLYRGAVCPAGIIHRTFAVYRDTLSALFACDPVMVNGNTGPGFRLQVVTLSGFQ